MYYKLKSILTSCKMRQEVANIHRSLSAYPLKTLIEFYMIGTGWSLQRTQKAVSDSDNWENIKTYMERGKTGQFKQFGVYDLIDTGYMWKRSEFIKEIKDDIGEAKYKKIFENPKPTMHDLTKVSLWGMDMPNLVFPVKSFLINLGREEEFDGILPYTSPVNKATNELFGLNFSGDQYGHTLFCRDIGREIGESPMYVNTAMWLFGVKT